MRRVTHATTFSNVYLKKNPPGARYPVSVISKRLLNPSTGFYVLHGTLCAAIRFVYRHVAGSNYIVYDRNHGSGERWQSERALSEY